MQSAVNLRACAVALAVVVTGFWAAPAALATMVEFQLTWQFSGGADPEGPSPWLTATFDDHDTPGNVDLTLAATNLFDAEFVRNWYFNLDPALEPTDLVFSSPTKTGVFDDPSIDLGIDAFDSEGGGLFDVLFSFADGDDAALRFGAGESALYSISGIPSLTADSFYFYSVSSSRSTGPGEGLLTVAQVCGIGRYDDECGKITTPEPTSAMMTLAGLVAVLRRRR